MIRKRSGPQPEVKRKGKKYSILVIQQGCVRRLLPYDILVVIVRPRQCNYDAALLAMAAGLNANFRHYSEEGV